MHLYALTTNRGNLRWKYRSNNKIYSSPSVNDGTVYFASVEGALYAIQ
jgi:outer membrane protein assembly factor BamB